MNVISTKRVAKEKNNGHLCAQFVAMGCGENEMYKDVHSSVVNMFTIKMFLSNIVSNSSTLHHMDVKKAFLHGELM